MKRWRLSPEAFVAHCAGNQGFAAKSDSAPGATFEPLAQDMPDWANGIWGQGLATLPGGQVITVGQIVSVVLLFAAAYFGSRLAGFLIGRRLAATRLAPDAVAVLKRVVFFGLLILVFLVALHLLGIPITAFAFAMGAIAIAIGFGAQNILNNFISGWILMAERLIRS